MHCGGGGRWNFVLWRNYGTHGRSLTGGASMHCTGRRRCPTGEGAIRTHGAIACPPVFKTGTFNRSVTSPESISHNLRGLPTELSGAQAVQAANGSSSCGVHRPSGRRRGRGLYADGLARRVPGLAHRGCAVVISAWCGKACDRYGRRLPADSRRAADTYEAGLHGVTAPGDELEFRLAEDSLP